MTAPEAEALGEFRRFNYERVYLRPASRHQAAAVVDMLRALVEHYAGRRRRCCPTAAATTRCAPRSPTSAA